MRPKIFVFTTSYFPLVGGAEVAIREVARRLQSRYDFVIITARQRRDLPSQESMREGAVIRVGFGTRSDKWILPFWGCAIVAWRRIVHDRKAPLLIWGMDISQGSVAGLLFKWMFPRVPLVFTIQYGYGDERIANGRGGGVACVLRRLLRAADAVTAISTYLKDVAHTYGYEGHVAIIPNGVDADFFGNRGQPSEEKKEKNVIITVSRLVEKNGVDTLIRAVALARKNTPDITCMIVGEGPERPRLEALAEHLGLRDHITFFGSVPYENLPYYLHRADVFVRPSRSEGMGNAFVEADAAGLPVIGTAVGGIPDVIREGESGLFCRVDDADDCAEKILLVLQNPKIAARMAEHGRRRAHEHFSWKTIAASYGKVFGHMISPHPTVLIATPLFPPEIGGPATYSKLLSEYLPEQGIVVRIAKFADVRHLPKIVRHLAFFFRVWSQARLCHLVYAQDPVSVGLPAMLAARLARKPYVLKIVGDYAWEQGVQRFGVTDLLDDFLQKKYGIRVELLRAFERMVAKCADRIIVPSAYLKNVVALWGANPKMITIIPNAFNAPRNLPSRPEARDQLDLTGSIVVSAGRLVAWKGFAVLIQCMADLVARRPGLMLFIAGAGPQEGELQDLVRAHKLEGHIKFLGAISRSELVMYLRAADVFVLNTGYEGFSHTILEAMACGAPVVTTASGGNVELIRHGKNGFLAPYNDREKFTAAISEVLDMPSKMRAAISEEAEHTALQFSEERMIQGAVEIIRESIVRRR